MKGVILAGGNGTRLLPLTRTTNKHLLPIFDKPMIFYPVETLRDAGITEILVVTSGEHAGNVFRLLGSGKEFGVKFTYKVQDEAGGIAQALALAKEFVGTDKFVVILGDNLLSKSIREEVEMFENSPRQSLILLTHVSKEAAKKLGVLIVNKDLVCKFVEKPQDPPDNPSISIGVYMYTPDVFNVIHTLKPSARGELEITDIHNIYLSKDELDFTPIRGQWLDAGTIEELSRANQEVRKWRNIE